MLLYRQTTKIVNAEQGHWACCLNNTPSLLQVYNNIIQEQEKQGFIEKIDSSPPTVPAHYIPHHYVNKDFKTTPIRIVYDCIVGFLITTPVSMIVWRLSHH